MGNSLLNPGIGEEKVPESLKPFPSKNPPFPLEGIIPPSFLN